MTGSVVRAFSAGLQATRIHPVTAAVMAEPGVPIAGQRSKTLAEFAGETFDLVVTVCDNAREACPAFPPRCDCKLPVLSKEMTVPPC